jgi:UDP-glucose 4-epimerase
MIIGVTGSSGFIGSYLVQKLQVAKHDVIEISRAKGYDILVPASLNSLPKMDIIIHLAAVTYVPESFNSPSHFFNVNVQGTNNMLDVARINNSKFIFISSYLYGIPSTLPTNEQHALTPTNPYAASKLMAENLCKHYNSFFNTEVVIVRPFNIYGKGQAKEFLIPKIIDLARTGTLSLFDSRPKRDYVYVEDLIHAIVSLIDHVPESGFQIFNVGSGESYSVKEVVKIVLDNLKNPVEVSYDDETKEIPIPNTVADISALNKATEWKPTVSLAEGIQKMME